MFRLVMVRDTENNSVKVPNRFVKKRKSDGADFKQRSETVAGYLLVVRTAQRGDVVSGN